MKPFPEMLINILVVNVLFYHRRIKVDCFVGNHRREGGEHVQLFLQFYCLHSKLDQTFLQPARQTLATSIAYSCLLGDAKSHFLTFRWKSNKNGPNEKMCKRILATKKENL